MIFLHPRLVSRFGSGGRSGAWSGGAWSGRRETTHPVSNGARLSNAAFLREIKRLADVAQHGKRRKVVSK